METKIWNSEIFIGNKKIKNRIVFPPLTCNWADSDGSPNEKMFEFYSHQAKGGSGMIVVEATAVSPEGKGSTNTLVLESESKVEKFKKIADSIKSNNCFASIQLMHVGGQGNPDFTGSQPFAPSSYNCKATGFSAREITNDEIDNLKMKFIFSAKLAEQSGFDAVEIHLAHGYLLHEFLSEYFNKRKDKYGGSIENRTRLVLDIIKGIKENTNLMLGVRVSGEDYLENGINFEKNKEILPLLEKAGVEYFSVTAGIYDTAEIRRERMKKGEFFEYSRKIKSIVEKPVIGVGKILDIESAEKHLKNNDCDLVAIGRAQLADPYMIKKYIGGVEPDKCLECGDCQYLRMGRKNVKCRVRKL